jgi:hypothetical protein
MCLLLKISLCFRNKSHDCGVKEIIAHYIESKPGFDVNVNLERKTRGYCTSYLI